jgi:hypothetical protein
VIATRQRVMLRFIFVPLRPEENDRHHLRLCLKAVDDSEIINGLLISEAALIPSRALFKWSDVSEREACAELRLERAARAALSRRNARRSIAQISGHCPE